MLKYFCLFILIFINGTASHAQEKSTGIRLELKVVNANGNPLSGVKITSKPFEKAFYTSNNGTLIIQDLLTATYGFEFSLMGYSTTNITVQVDEDMSKTVVLQVEPIHIQDVSVTGIDLTHVTTHKHRLDEQTKQELKGKTLADQLSSIAGVTQLNTGASIAKPMINGLHSNRILIMNNGVRQEGQQWGVEHAPEIDPFSVGNFEVVKGALGVRYGADALGGIVILRPNEISDATLSGKVDLIGQSNGRGGNANVQLEGTVLKFPGLKWRIQSSLKKLGNLQAADYILGNTAMNEKNWSGLVKYTSTKDEFETYYSYFNTEIGVFAGAHVGNIDDIYAIIENGKPFDTYDFSYAINNPRQQIHHHLAKAKWTRLLENSGKVNIQYAFQKNLRQEFDLRRTTSDGTPMSDMHLTTQTVDINYEKGHLQTGINAMTQVNNNIAGTGTTPIIPNFDNHNVGAYIVYQMHGDKWHSEFGGRYDFRYFDVAGYRYDYSKLNSQGGFDQYLLKDHKVFHNISGNAGISYHINDNTSVKSNVGLAWRAPSANELYSDGLHHGSGTYEIGNPNFVSEKGYKWTNSFIHTTDFLDVDVEAFAQYIDGYIYANPQPDSVRQTIRGTFPVFKYQQNNAFLYGVDFNGKLKLNKNLRYRVTASLLRAKDVDNNVFLPLIPADRLQHGLEYLFYQEYDAYVRLDHRLVAHQSRIEKNSDYADAPPSYHLFALYAGSQIPVGDRSVTLNLSVENLFNKSYKDYLDRMRYYAHQLGINITLGITYKF